MKLFRFGPVGGEKPGLILADGRKIDAATFGEDYNEGFFETGGLGRLSTWAAEHAADAPTVGDDIRIGSPVARPSKIICIGLNYADHAAEAAAELPPEPIVFSKASTSLCGPNDGLIIPRDSEQTDWEVEIAFVIGKKASYVEEADAHSHIAGFALMNDYSERAFQHEKQGQWIKGKSNDSFAPLGPFLATPDELADPYQLGIWLKVNGQMMQDSNTDQLVFKAPFLISYLSRFMTLLPGDVVSTGTPGGVGAGFKPPIFLKAGDEIELGIDGLGTQRQVATQA
jgi:2,4-diketo-3-deoxy-L-fuconate hydrolase